MLSRYKQTIKELKSMILSSRYRAAALANKELLLLYFSVGNLIVEKSKIELWGSGVLENIAADLQKELPGLRGFSSSNLKKMRVFSDSWANHFQISSSLTNQLNSKSKAKRSRKVEISSLLTNQFKEAFFSISFTHHYKIVSSIKSVEERIFYIENTAAQFWSVTTLTHQIQSRLFKKKGRLPNNFSTTIINEAQREKALQVFKDEYLFNFMNIEDPDLADERELEDAVVRNIRKFILSIGSDFAFLGNQYRLIVDEEEFFIDLLFFNRKLQSLVAFELKTGKFKPEYLGKMNFYLSALDEMVKQPHEQPSIGIILCKSKSDKIVEFSFRHFNKAMGVATYKTSKELPSKYKGILPEAKELKKLL